MALSGRSVAIIGAGVGGLTAAIALARRGARVEVLEQADALREVGAGLQVSPNAGRVLGALGVDLSAQGLRAEAVTLRDGLSGDVVLRMALPAAGEGADYRFLHRVDLVAALWARAQELGVRLHLLHQIAAPDLSGPWPRWRSDRGAEGEAELILAADGLHSRARGLLNPGAGPFFTGQIAWRTLVPAHPGDPPEAEVHMGPGRHLVSYPLRSGRIRNIVAVEERRRWTEEGWSLRDDPLEMRLAFAAFNPRARAWLEAAEDVWLWGLFRHPVAQTWTRLQGQGAIALLGDAAHPTLPFLAQGAAMAIEDAWVLADCLDRLPLAEALAAYQARRLPRVRRIVAAANGNARAYHLSGALRGLAHSGLRLLGALAPSLPLARFDWLYGHDVTAPAGN